MVVKLGREELTRRRAGYAAEVQEEVYHNHYNALQLRCNNAYVDRTGGFDEKAQDVIGGDKVGDCGGVTVYHLPDDRRQQIKQSGDVSGAGGWVVSSYPLPLVGTHS